MDLFLQTDEGKNQKHQSSAAEVLNEACLWFLLTIRIVEDLYKKKPAFPSPIRGR